MVCTTTGNLLTSLCLLIYRVEGKALHDAIKCENAQFLNFLDQLLLWDPNLRMTPSQALQHEWVLSNAYRPQVQRDGRLGIIDVVIEGVSMSVSERQEFASVIQAKGGSIDAFLQALREKVATMVASSQ